MAIAANSRSLYDSTMTMLTDAVIEQVNSTLVGSGTANLADCRGTNFTIATAPGGAALRGGLGSDIDFSSTAPAGYYMNYTVTAPCGVPGKNVATYDVAGTSTRSACQRHAQQLVSRHRRRQAKRPLAADSRARRCGPARVTTHEYSMHMRQSERGFSIAELVVTMGIFTVVMGVMFQQIDQAQHASAAQRTKLDIFQEARAFMDLMARDLHEAGYPSPRSFAPGVLTLNPLLPRSPYSADSRVAVGLTRVEAGGLWFEGDVDGNGTVAVRAVSPGPDGNNCPCLRRSQQPKPVPVRWPRSRSTRCEVQNVRNGTAAEPDLLCFQSRVNGHAADAAD